MEELNRRTGKEVKLTISTIINHKLEHKRADLHIRDYNNGNGLGAIAMKYWSPMCCHDIPGATFFKPKSGPVYFSKQRTQRLKSG